MKAEFSNLEKLRDWLANVVNATKYDFYYVPRTRRLYVIKNVSTDPKIHGFVENVDIDDVDAVASDLGRPLTLVKSWEWDHESSEKTDAR